VTTDRPRYETKDDVNAEDAVAAVAGPILNCTFKKLSEIHYGVDFAMRQGRLFFGYAEVKRRRIKHHDFTTYVVSMAKFTWGLALADRAAVPFVLLVQYDDALVCYDATAIAAAGLVTVEMGGRSDRGDPKDIEPMAHMPVDSGRVLKEGNPDRDDAARDTSIKAMRSVLPAEDEA